MWNFLIAVIISPPVSYMKGLGAPEHTLANRFNRQSEIKIGDWLTRIATLPSDRPWLPGGLGCRGDDDEMARLFSYDPVKGSYEMLGMIDVNRRPYYSWQAYVIDAVAVGIDGTVYLGQSERKSKLYLYYPE